jgi:hypothetical protein
MEQSLFLLKVQSTVIQNNELIREALAHDLVEEFVADPELILNEDPTRLIELFQIEFEKHFGNTKKIKIIDEFKDHLIELTHESRSIIRTQGLGLGVLFISMEIGQFIVAGVLAGAGHPEIATAIGAVPYNEMLLFGKVALGKLLKIRQTYQIYGGKENYQFFKNIHKQVKHSLKIHGKDGTVISIASNAEGGIDAISMSRLGFLNKLLSRVLPNRNKLDLVTLKHFLKKNHLKHQLEIESILDEDVEDWVKISFVVNVIQRNHPEIFEDFKNKFSKSLIEIEPFVISDQLQQWSFLAQSAETREDFLYVSSHVPSGLRVLDVIKIWAKCLMPQLLEESRGLGYSSYRYFVKHLSFIEGASEVHFNELWSDAWTQQFNGYFLSAFQMDKIEN